MIKFPTELNQYANQTQLQYLELLQEGWSYRQVADHFETRIHNITAAISKVRAKAAKAGFAPEADLHKPIPTGFSVKGVSTYYDQEGKPRGQWIKTKADQEEKYQRLLEAMEVVLEPYQGESRSIKAPTISNSELLCVYPMGDPHFGLFSWHKETGIDWDLEKAKSIHLSAVDHLVDLAPPSEQALILNLGDFFHTDSMDNQTRRSGHKLDVDTRYAKILQVGILTMRQLIYRALEKHKEVTVINVIGNHDDHSAMMLSLCLEAYFCNDERVRIITDPKTFHYFEFGCNLIGVTHGHTCKPQELPQVMATDKPKSWGNTHFRYWYTGHVHHESVKEYSGCLVETFRTLAAPDNYTVSHGYRAGRDMKLDVLHKDYGRITRHSVGVAQLWF